MKNKLLAICIGVTSASAMAWTPGEFSGEFNIKGTITRDSLAQLWEWKVGAGLNFDDSVWDHLSENKTKLTLSVDKPEGILYGRTKEAIDRGGDTSATVLPQITFSDYANNQVSLEQDSGDAGGKGHITLPIKNANDNTEIGKLKVNLTSVGLAVGPANASNGGEKTAYAISLHANGQQHALSGGLFPKVVAGTAIREPNATMGRFQGQGQSINELLAQLNKSHSTSRLLAGYSHSIDFTSAGTPFTGGVASVSYVLGIDQDQTLEATFNSPISSTTEWSAPLKVAVTYQ